MDDGFDWLDGLPTDLQRRVWHLMDCVAEGRHAEVEAVVPGLVARAREERLPWVEVFARNFELRSVVLHREDTRTGLGRAVALLDWAHRPDTRDCPQTICTAHAVCAAYGIKDPDGYIDERLAVSLETLGRTDPRRVCWLCISNEHADALIDAGRPDDALAFLSRQRATRLAAGAAVDPDDFGLREVAAHVAAGRHRAAMTSLDGCVTDARGSSWQRTWRQWKAQLLAAEGRADEAVPFLSTVEDILADGGFRRHFATLPLIFGRLPTAPDTPDGPLTDDEIIRQMVVLGRASVERGGGTGVDALCWAAARLLDQGELALCRAVLEVARTGVPVLRRGSRARARLAGLTDALERAGVGEAPVGRFEAEVRAQRKAPDASRAAELAAACRRRGLPELGRALLDEARGAIPDDEALYQRVAVAALDADDLAAVEALIAAPPATEDGPFLARWFAAELAAAEGDRFDAIPHLEALCAARPGWAHASERLGGLLFEKGRYAEADAVWARTATLGEGPNVFHWSCIGAATADGDWARVRELAREVGFPVPAGAGPIDGDFGILRVCFEDDPRPFYARRSGPVTARVLSLRTPGEPQRHGSTVLFHPAPDNLDALESDPDALPVHRVVMTLEETAYECVALDGRHPGPAAMADLRSRLEAEGWFFQFAAGDEYVVVDPTTGAAHPGVYLLVAVQRDQLARVQGLFEGIDAPGPRVWTALLELRGRRDEAMVQQSVAEAWQMV